MAKSLFGKDKENSPLDSAFAKQLKAILIKHRKLAHNVRTANWPKEFQHLRSSISEERISFVLKWLEEHLTDPYTPLVRSARTFRLKFSAIEAAMSRAAASPQADDKPLTITDEARKVVEYAGFLIFPCAADNQLAAGFAQRSLDNYKVFRERLHLLSQHLPQGTRDQKACLWLYETLNVPHDFMKGWLIETWRWIWQWHEHGQKTELMRHVFRWESKRFQRMLEPDFANYSTDPGLQSRIMEHIKNYENKTN